MWRCKMLHFYTGGESCVRRDHLQPERCKCVTRFLYLQEIDSKADGVSSTGNISLSLGQLSLDAAGSGGLWQPVKMNDSGVGDDRVGRMERSNSFDSHSSDGLGFNARDGNGLCGSILSPSEKL